MMHFCKTLDEASYKQYTEILKNLSRLSNSDIVKMIHENSAAPNWTYYPELWPTGISSLKQQLTDNLIASNPSATLYSCKVSNAIWTSVPPIIFLLGTIGNLLSFIVLCHPSMSQISSYVYLATLAIVDEAVLVFGLLRQWMDRLIGQRIEDMSSVSCKLSQIVGISSSCLSVWLIVALTVERVIVITFPLQANRYASPSRAKIIILTLAFLFIAVSLHFIETVDLINPNQNINSSSIAESAACEFKQKYSQFGRAWTIIDATFYSYAPLMFISVMNTIILFQVYKARRSRRSLFHDQNCSMRRSSLKVVGAVGSCASGPSSTSCNSRSSEGSRQLTIMLFVISCCFMITTAPIVILKVLTRIKTHSRNPEKGKFELADTVATMLMYYNHAMNFFLYCATGNKFRQQLKRIVCGRHCLQETAANNSCQYNSNYNARLQVRRSTRTSALTSSDEAVELRNLLPSAFANSRLHN